MSNSSNVTTNIKTQDSFKPFEVGTLFNTILELTQNLKPKYKTVTIKYPSRLEAMALDPSKVQLNEKQRYTAGQINFGIDVFKNCSVKVNDSNDVVVGSKTKRPALVKHAALIMKQVLGFEGGFSVAIEQELDLRHCGLGSSSSTIAAVVSCINELFGNPLSPLQIVQLCAQNHGEEIDDSDHMLMPVQCLGGSAIMGNFTGGLQIIAGSSTPVFKMSLKERYAVIALKEDQKRDSYDLMNEEAENMDGFIKTGKDYSDKNAYNLIHSVLPGLVHGDLSNLRDLIFEYRWNQGSIKNCSVIYPSIVYTAEQLRPLVHDDNAEIIALSSVGPAFFVVTKNPKSIEPILKRLGLKIFTVPINNDKYKVVRATQW